MSINDRTPGHEHLAASVERTAPEVRSEIENSLMPLLLVLARQLKLLVLVPLLAGALALVYSKVTDPIYAATTRILPPQYNENTVLAINNQLGGESQLGNSSLTLQNPIDLFVGVLNSRTIIDGVIAKMGLEKHYGIGAIYEIRQKLAASTDISAGKDGIVSIIVEDTDPQVAADLANAYVQVFYELSSTLAKEEAGRRAQFFDRAIDQARQSLLIADAELSQYENETGFTRLQGQDEAILQPVAEIRAEISAREVQLRTMSSYATQNNPDVMLINHELDQLRRELDRLRRQTSTGVSEPFLELGRVPEVSMEHARRQRSVQYWENIVDLLGKFIELGKIDERRDMSLFQILDVAIAPEFKSKPRTVVNMGLAIIGSGLACLLWVLGSAYIQQRRVRSPEFDRQWQELLGEVVRVVRFSR